MSVFRYFYFNKSLIKDSGMNSTWGWSFVERGTESESTYLVFDW